jgi:hypothetical protein
MTELEALVRFVVAIAGWPETPNYSDEELRETLEDTLEHGSEEDRKALSVLLAFVQEFRA